MAAGDQRWDPHVEDAMMRWTSKGAERDIERAARSLGTKTQFKRKRKIPVAAESGVVIRRGVAARIEAPPAPYDEDAPIVVELDEPRRKTRLVKAVPNTRLLSFASHDED